MAPYSLSQPLSSVSFEEKMKFSASQSLSFARSKWFALPQTESQSVVWSIKPPDFSLKLYRSLSDPQKKDRNTHSNPVVLHNNETKRRTGVLLPKILHESYQRENPPKFITSYKPPDALESELMFVKTGKFPSGSYKNPKPHDFRQVRLCEQKELNALYLLLYVCHPYLEQEGKASIFTLISPWRAAPNSVLCNVLFYHKMAINTKVKKKLLTFCHLFQLNEDIPDIVTTYDRDPGNLNFKLKHLDISKWINF